MKRIAVFLVTILLCNLLAPVSLANGNDVVIEGTTLVSYSGNATKFSIPDGITVVAPEAFSGDSKLERLQIPASVAELSLPILSNLVEFSVDPDNPVFYSIDGVLFQRDGTLRRYPSKRGFEKYTIPDGIRVIGRSAFAQARIDKIIMPDSVEEIENGAFFNIRPISDISSRYEVQFQFSNRLHTIGEAAFGYAHILDITLPDSLKRIERGAFYDCPYLRSVTISDEVEYIGEKAFIMCDQLGKVNIPTSLDTIAKNTFEHCKSLTEIEIPGNVKTIGEYAFHDTGLSTLTLGQGIETVEKYAFLDCDSLKTIAIPDSVTRIGEYAFGFREMNICTAGYLSIDHAQIHCNLGTTAARYVVKHNYDYQAPQGELGDVNSDKQLNAVDALMILQHSVDLISLDQDAQLRADVDCDGLANAEDALLILQRSVHLTWRFYLDEMYIEEITTSDEPTYHYIL